MLSMLYIKYFDIANHKNKTLDYTSPFITFQLRHIPPLFISHDHSRMFPEELEDLPMKTTSCMHGACSCQHYDSPISLPIQRQTQQSDNKSNANIDSAPPPPPPPPGGSFLDQLQARKASILPSNDTPSNEITASLPETASSILDNNQESTEPAPYVSTIEDFICIKCSHGRQFHYNFSEGIATSQAESKLSKQSSNNALLSKPPPPSSAGYFQSSIYFEIALN